MSASALIAAFPSRKSFLPIFRQIRWRRFKKNICQLWKGNNYSGKRTFQEAVNTYKLGIYSATLKREKHIVLAGLYMRLAWLYRTYQVPDQEVRFMRLALEEYTASYNKDDFVGTHMSEVRLLYLIGELHRRLNQPKQAVLYFSKVIAKKKGNDRKRNCPYGTRTLARYSQQPTISSYIIKKKR